MNYDDIIFQIHEIFEYNRDRYIIEEALQELGFRLWGHLEDNHGRPNRDEQIWAYDVSIPNGQILLLVNWAGGFYWIYRKVDRGDLV